MESSSESQAETTQPVEPTPGQQGPHEGLAGVLRRHVPNSDALDSAAYAMMQLEREHRRDSSAERISMGAILGAYADRTRRHIKRRDGFSKVEESENAQVGHQIYTAEMVARHIGVRHGDAEPLRASDPPEYFRRDFRLVSASIRVGTPRGTIKELWYEEL